MIYEKDIDKIFQNSNRLKRFKPVSFSLFIALFNLFFALILMITY